MKCTTAAYKLRQDETLCLIGVSAEESRSNSVDPSADHPAARMLRRREGGQ